MVNKPKQIEFFDILIQQNDEIFCCAKPSGLIQQNKTDLEEEW